MEYATCQHGYAQDANMLFDINFMGDLDVNWTDNYKREQKATWEDLADAVRDSVSMRDAIGFYVPEASPRNRRMPCPIHNGVDNNFSFTDTSFRCFVCNESGDVIEFVKQVCNLRGRSDAIKQINKDFHLGLPIERGVSLAENKAIEERRRSRYERVRKQKALWTVYHSALDRYIALDIIKREQAPKSEDDAVTLQYVYACKHIDEAWYNVTQAIIALNEFEAETEGKKVSNN